MAKEIVTIFFRDDNINLLVMKGKRVAKWASLALEPGLVSQGVILDEAQVADRVRELFRLQKVKTRRVIAGLSGLNSLYRLIVLPELPEAILDEAIKHEARRVMPVSLDDVYISYQSVPASRGERRVFLAAFPHNVADTVLRTLRKAGLEPYLMDLAPLALCRIPDEPRAIIVNTRKDHLNIMVIADRLPQLIRWLSLPIEAESLSEKLPAITEELSRTITFYNSSHLEKPLDATVPVFVSGELAEAPETWQSLVGTFNYPVSPLPSPVEHLEGFPLNEFMVNIGLALKELLPQKAEANFSIINLNTMPEVYLPKGVSLIRIFAPIGVIIGIGLLVYIGFLAQSSSAQANVLRSQLALAEGSITQQQQAIATIKEQIKQVEPQIRLVKAQIEQVGATTGIFNATLASLKQEREKVDGDLHQIAALVPDDIALLYGGEQVTIGDSRLDQAKIDHYIERVTVVGTAPTDLNAVFKYARDLRASGRFSTVLITSIVAYQAPDSEEKGYNFDFLLE